VKVYTRNRADLSRVTDNAFVGITSVPQPDGTQRATEIHVFPQELRGLGEGSRPMTAPASGGTPSTMTNGSVSGSRMTNGSARMTNGAARMTNGTSKGAAGGTVTVAYNGGSQTITVPPDVPVTVLEATSAKLEPGANVVVVGTRQADGSLKTSRVMLSGSPPGQSNQ
jgi:X-X-X-Leu-X-X-Gly heptad repeat protein